MLARAAALVLKRRDVTLSIVNFSISYEPLYKKHAVIINMLAWTSLRCPTLNGQS